MTDAPSRKRFIFHYCDDVIIRDDGITPKEFHDLTVEEMKAYFVNIEGLKQGNLWHFINDTDPKANFVRDYVKRLGHHQYSLKMTPIEKKECLLPPAFAEFLFALLGPKDRIETMLGDLQELFERDCKGKGQRRARVLYWARCLRSTGPLLVARLRNWGAFAAVIEYGRHKIGW